MKKLTTIAVLCVGLAAPMSLANYVTNGDFEAGTLEGWTQWGPIGWGSGEVRVEDTAASVHSGSYGLRIRTTPNGSLGVKQVVAVPANTPLTLSAWVKAPGASYPVNWAEVLLYPFAVTDDATQIDNNSDPYLVWKRDSWGGKDGVPGGFLPTPNQDWELVTGTITSPTGFVTIAFKFGQNDQLNAGNIRVDDVVLVPEPAAALLLVAGLPLLRRRR
ncbi:MAG TPA: carbohydrate binding domain-containing protein [Phycisphaerae bacterium]|nr:carbohydrate binding domain-containing protein [Phycisphaerae bacterium]HOJ74086.1 carbohydrate binding domain-containing protein [Phycisphaerae bacterium]HOM50681.1 carbohydrate binding domain-containing protein [Phycisphaerae bacterium]HON67523.1 carbohydrate binding domain-containing protein [Phycisphaerae bacterium]HOQ85103.1 carbohydrate binding domain-containing protein [Phycisphaerae bacterium]